MKDLELAVKGTTMQLQALDISVNLNMTGGLIVKWTSTTIHE